MKKILLFVMAAALFCGCDKNEGGDPEIPVTNVSLPASSAENPVTSGSPVTIQGTGFTASSEIWLRASAAVKAAAEEVKTTVTSVTASSITFTAPENVSGAQTVVLKQNGGAWELGTLTFAAEPTGPEEPTDPTTPELLPNKVSNIRVTFKDEYKGDYVTEYAFAYDEQGRIAKLVTTEYEEDADDVLTTTYTYSDNSILAEGSGTGYIRSQTEKYTLTDGRVSDYTIETVGSGKYDDVPANTRITARPAYDQNGYMTGIEVIETNDEDGDVWTSVANESLTFIDGTLQKYSVEWNEEDEAENGMTEIEFTAGPLNNLNIDLMGIDWLEEDVYFTPAYLLNVGGKRSLRLPNHVHTIYDDGMGKEDDFTIEIQYEMNGDYISVMRIYEDGELDTTIEIGYEKE